MKLFNFNDTNNTNYVIRFNYLVNLIFLIVISCSILVVGVSLGPIQGQSEHGDSSWARFCGVNKDNEKIHQDVFSDKCRAGAWFDKNEIEWKCLCTMGAWALRFSWCDGEKPVMGFGSDGFARFTTPELSCFRIAQDVTNGQVLEGILNLGKWSNKFKEGAPLIWTKAVGGTVLTRRDLVLPKIKQIPLVANVSTIYALRSLPKPGTVWSIICDETNTAVCLQPPSRADSNVTLFSYEISHLWTRNGSSRARIHLNFDMEPNCDTTKHASHVWINVAAKGLSQFVLPKLDIDNLDDDCKACLAEGSPYNPSTTTEKCYPKDLEKLSALGNEVDLQSQRLAAQLGQKILMNKTGAMIIKDIPEMAFLIKGSIMALGACDMNYIPKQFYQFFLILVEALLSESYVKYPPNPLSKDKYEKILQILDTCMASTEPFKIHPDNSCPPSYDTYEVPGQKNPLKADIFKEIIADPRKHDYIVEYIFKIVSFVHYHCYPHFKEAPFLHDVLQVQMESIFRDDLLMRWAYPSNSFAMLQNLFRIHFDVKVTMQNFEKCIVMTHTINNYKSVLKKPINQPNMHPPEVEKRRKRRSIRKSRRMEEATFMRRREKHFETEDFNPTESHLAQQQLENKIRRRSKKTRKRTSNYDDNKGSSHNVIEDHVINKERYTRGSDSHQLGQPSSSDSSNSNDSYLDWAKIPYRSRTDAGDSWAQDLDKYDEDSFPVNNETGIFKGDYHLACLESLPEFVEMNPQYDLYGPRCWSMDDDGMIPMPKYLDL